MNNYALENKSALLKYDCLHQGLAARQLALRLQRFYLTCCNRQSFHSIILPLHPTHRICGSLQPHKAGD